MDQTIEIEFKNMLTKNEYERLLKQFNITKSNIFPQENHYFDTPDFLLKQAGAALRIRNKQDQYEMTLKQPLEEGLLETNQQITKETAIQAIEASTLPLGEIKRLIEQLGISYSSIQFFGSLVTKRAEVPYKNGLLVLDHSFYFQKEDYELEFEVEQYQSGKIIFLELLKQFEIPERQTENKIRRFYNEKNKKHN